MEVAIVPSCTNKPTHSLESNTGEQDPIRLRQMAKQKGSSRAYLENGIWPIAPATRSQFFTVNNILQ